MTQRKPYSRRPPEVVRRKLMTKWTTLVLREARRLATARPQHVSRGAATSAVFLLDLPRGVNPLSVIDVATTVLHPEDERSFDAWRETAFDSTGGIALALILQDSRPW